MTEYNLYPIYFLILLTNSIYIKSLFITIMRLLILLMMKVLLSFLLKLNSRNTEADSPHFSQLLLCYEHIETLSNQITFKPSIA